MNEIGEACVLYFKADKIANLKLILLFVSFNNLNNIRKKECMLY